MATDVTLVKGMRIRAQWFRPHLGPASSLAGVQMKFSASLIDVTGIVRHIRVDNQENPTDYQIFIDPDQTILGVPLVQLDRCTCGRGHLQVDPKHIISAEHVPG